MEEKEITMLEFGKEYVCGNYIVEKTAYNYDEEAKARLAETGLPGEIRKIAEEKGFVPYMTLRDVSGLFEVKILFGTLMYNFFDTMELTEEGDISDAFKKACEKLIETMYKVCNLVPDVECVKAIDDAYDAFFKRMEEKAKEETADGEE